MEVRLSGKTMQSWSPRLGHLYYCKQLSIYQRHSQNLFEMFNHSKSYYWGLCHFSQHIFLFHFWIFFIQHVFSLNGFIQIQFCTSETWCESIPGALLSKAHLFSGRSQDDIRSYGGSWNPQTYDPSLWNTMQLIFFIKVAQKMVENAGRFSRRQKSS